MHCSVKTVVFSVDQMQSLHCVLVIVDTLILTMCSPLREISIRCIQPHGAFWRGERKTTVRVYCDRDIDSVFLLHTASSSYG